MRMVSAAEQRLGARAAGRTRVKICGITRAQDARDAVALGADAIGLVFYAPSPRAVDVSRARELAAMLPPFVSAVAVFVNPEPALVREVLAAVPVDLLQFHGTETAEECEQYGRPYLKTVSMREEVDLLEVAARHAGARALLLDTWHREKWGGTGDTFDWSLIPAALDKPVILAGGLTPDNVAAAVRAIRPYAVDVSGGVEASGGIKDAARIAAFMRGVSSVEAGEAHG